MKQKITEKALSHGYTVRSAVNKGLIGSKRTLSLISPEGQCIYTMENVSDNAAFYIDPTARATAADNGLGDVAAVILSGKSFSLRLLFDDDESPVGKAAFKKWSDGRLIITIETNAGTEEMAFTLSDLERMAEKFSE